MQLSCDDIAKTIERLNELKSNLNDLSTNVAIEIAEKTKDKAKENYELLSFNKTHPKPTFEVTQESSKTIISASGTGVIYDEYGTGLQATRPHIGKSRAFLNSGYEYWFMPKKVANEHNDGNTFTKGHAPGYYMYHADVWMRDNYKKIVKEKVDDVLSKV